MKHSKQKKQQGFTLIELMIVVAIIGVLSAVAIPAYKSYVTKSELASGATTVRNLLTNIDMYQQENGTYVGMTLPKVGASTTMSGLGNLALANLTVSSADATFTFDNSSVNTAVITYSKSSSGWVCSITPNSATAITAETRPKGC
ncbi:prepilin-type N-terminal cleavage/methylation domain-containing protein [Vibrio parahaemolyticus]|nr:prepilin-type N-terminal cleavage/methylation domain-containing protein [Vibrio parahaemolyticus]EHV5557907.1 prepilin-type N-terminal cleavage/methylation domain-containing protein [Vibrio parahaemolyticus]EIU7003849.1 prepilin-type N-terminal cleavage/methylation domain-containing protein [Vibrio parahaemolyticus]EJI6685645.1 prepilin-type N-terminal cleavage/methylation domain-containing protein [Vibrio parahaemolyticus]ELA9069190.1 prepilin-type N-terminal cleavage/methylation domain-con